MRINTNVSALRAQLNLSNVENEVSKSMAKLSSGFRITRASDDAAGLGIANTLRADIRAMNQAARNSEQAGSVLNIADGAAGSIQKMLERMKELAAQAASDSVDSAGRARITAEYQALRAEIDRTVDHRQVPGQRPARRLVRCVARRGLDGPGLRHGRLQRAAQRRRHRGLHLRGWRQRGDADARLGQ